MKKRFGLYLITLLTFAVSGLYAQIGMISGDEFGELHFISRPPLTASVGEHFIYKAVAVSGDSTALIRYYSGASLSGFAIDSVTGVVSWTPAAKGWFRISIDARSSTGDKTEQEFTVQVSGGNGLVQGTVRDTLGQPIARVVVQALNTQPIMMISMGDDRGAFSYSAVTDSNGRYRISRIDPGTYKLHANSPSPNYLSQWYDGKSDPALANIITVRDTPNVTVADFVLRSGVSSLKKVTVKGSVTDSLGVALKLSASPRVFFVRAGFAFNSHSAIEDFREQFEDDAFEDFRLDGNSGFVLRANVDSTGAYSLQLPVGSYIAYASAKGYVTEYYRHQSDLRSANTLDLQRDSSGIDFRLVALPPVILGQISGSVVDSSKHVGVRSRVIVMRDHWTSSESSIVERSSSFDTDSLGRYTATNLVPGTYFALAIPMGNYSPAYYSTDTANIRWKSAGKIVVNGNAVSGINIYVRPLNPAVKGYAGVSGSVRAGAQSPVAGALVFAYLGGSVAGYSLTDNSGNYQISGISPNTYKIVVDMAGYDEPSSQTTTVSYTSSGSPVSSTASFSMTSVATSVEATASEQPVNFVLSQNYPNPFNPSTTISFQLTANSAVTLKVFDILGREVATLVNEVRPAGLYSVRWDASRAASGVYFYRLQAGQIVETKQMVLLK